MEKTKPHFVPCRCSRTRTIPKENFQPAQPNETQKRPSSANSVKSSSGRKKNSLSKSASSDTKIPKPIAKSKTSPVKNKKESIDPECTKQLRDELRAIKEQLSFLSDRKKEALDVTNELETRYKNLKCRCTNQEKVIDELKDRNDKLEEQLQHQCACEHCLGEYGDKLNFLYSEFLETSKIMEQSRDKICRCIKEKSDEYQEMMLSKNELSKAIEDNSAKYENLMSNYQQCKESERKYIEQNQKLIQTLEGLENQLHQTMMQLNTCRQETVKITEKYQGELNAQKKFFTSQLETQANEITALKATIQQLESRVCKDKCRKRNDLLQSQYDQLNHKYKHMVNKLNFYQQNNKKRREEIETLKKHEETLIGELVKLQNHCNTLTNISKEHNVCLATMNSTNHEKDAVIKCQQVQMACKDKQIEILRKDEDRLKKRVIELQEEVVSMKIALDSKNNNTTVLCAEDCPIHLTDELEDLITALYEEIDKTLAKEEEIKKQKQQICCLHCTLEAKERELSRVRNQLKMLENRFCMALKEKQGMFDHFKERRFQYESSEESFEGCYCGNQ